MAAIDVDFDVFKALTALRETEAMTHNDVLRRILKLGNPTASNGHAGRSFVYKGVDFPDGTKLRATYKGRTYTAEIRDGAWLDEKGKRHNSPSAAAMAITKTQVNGWSFWEAKRPDAASFCLIDDFRC